MWWLKGRRKRENKRKRGRGYSHHEGPPSKPHVNLGISQRPYFLIPSHWGSRVDTIQSIAAIHSIAAICFYIKTGHRFILSVLMLIHFPWNILGTRRTFHQIYIINICGIMIGYENNALFSPRKWTFYFQSMWKFPWCSKSRCLFTVYWKNVVICCTWLFSFRTK